MKFFRSRHNLNFRRVAWIAVLTLMLPVLLPLWHHPAEAAQPNNRPICSMGIRHMAAADQHSGKSSSTKSTSCPICQGLHFFHSGFIAPVDAGVMQPADIATQVELPAYQAATAGRLTTAAWPHAPPSIA